MHGWEQQETYPCQAFCVSGGRYVEKNRRKFRCALVNPGEPVVPESDWDKNTQPMRIHMGLPPVLDNEQFLTVNNPRTPEEPHTDGCPGAWYRCCFARSIERYERLYHGQAGFIENVELSRCDDPLVISATRYLENQILHAMARDNETRAAES